MPIFSSSARAQLAYKLEGTYPTNFGVPQGGNGTLIDVLSESLAFDITNETSKAIRSDRQVPDLIQTGATSGGGFAFEHKYREYDPFIQAVIGSDYVQFGTNGVGAAIGTLTLASTTLTASVAPTGNDAFTNLQKGQWFSLIPPTNATQAVKDYLFPRVFRVSTVTSPTSTVITLDSVTPINTAITGTTMTNGKLGTSYAVNGNTMRSYTLEVQHTDVTQYRQHTGMVASKMDLSLSVGSIVTGSFDFMGKDFNILQATSMGTPTAAQAFTPANATKGVFDIVENGALISATTYIRSASLSIDNTLRGQDAIGVFGRAGIGQGTMQITGSMEVYFVDAGFYNRFKSGSASSLSIPVVDVDGNGYVYHFPRTKYSATRTNVGGLDQDNMLAVDWRALPDTTAGSPTLGKSVVIYRTGN